MPTQSSILFLGEELPNVEELRATLEEHEREILNAETVPEALELLGKRDTDAVVVSVSAENTVGIEAIETLRREREGILLIALLDAHDGDLAASALRGGADDVVFLRLHLEELEARLGVARGHRTAARQLKEEQDDIRLMSELTQTFASSLDFEDILFAVVQRIADSVRVDRCSIILTSQSTETGYVVASSEDPEIRDLPIELSKYPEVQKVLQEAQPLFIDVATDPLLDSVRSHIPADGPSTSALFPIMHEARVIGVLFLRFHAQRDELIDRELAMCQMVANATAISLRNARFVNAIRDEQARILEAHTEAEKKVEALSHYADFFESSADGMLVVDALGKVLYANPRMAALTGVTVEELTTRTLEDLVAVEELAILGRLLAGFNRGAYPRGLDIRFRGAFEQQVTLSVSASSTLRLAQGVLLVLRDVTSARATETELRQTKEFLEALIAQSVDAVLAADMKGSMLLFNPAAERIFGYEAKEVLGKTMIKELYPPGVAHRIMSLLCSEKYGGFGRLEQTRASVLGRDGEEIPISMTGGMIFEEGEPQATFGIFTDLRERLEMENDLARTRLELDQREREAIAAQLAGAAAHELNQPLTSVMTSIALLKRKLEGEELYAKLVKTINDEAERMAQIVRKIGRITKYETTTYVGSTQILDLNKAADPETSDSGPPLELYPEELEDDHPTAIGMPDVAHLHDDEQVLSEESEDEESDLEYQYYFGDEDKGDSEEGFVGSSPPPPPENTGSSIPPRRSSVPSSWTDDGSKKSSVYGLSNEPGQKKPEDSEDKS